MGAGAAADNAVADAVAEARAIRIPVLVIPQSMFDAVERYHRTRPVQHSYSYSYGDQNQRQNQRQRQRQRERGVAAMVPRVSVLWEEPDADLAAALIQSMCRGTALRERMRAVGVFEPHSPCRFAGAGAGRHAKARPHPQASRRRGGHAGERPARARTRHNPRVRARAQTKTTKTKTVTSMCACEHLAATRMPHRR